MYFIRAKSNISAQNSFKNPGWTQHVKKVIEGENIESPDYKEFIPSNILRRLSPILKNAITSATDCLQQSGEEFDSIIVGTGLGCLTDTEKFLITINNATAETDSISPTAFIQSTHNTIGGQISLFMKNHSYNMTHTQNSLSFEVSLLDAMLCVNEGKKNVLVGAADERIDFLTLLDDVIDRKDYPLSSGSTFFCLTSDKNIQLPVVLKDVEVHSNADNFPNKILSFLEKSKLKKEEISLVLFSGIHENEEMLADFPTKINYTQFAGFNYSNSAFAMDFGIEYLMNNSDKKYVLIINHLCVSNLGLILLEKI